MADESGKSEKGGADKKRPSLTPEQEAEAAKKKAARAEAKAGGGKGAGGKGKGAAKGGGGGAELAQDRVKREGAARLRKLFDAEVRKKLQTEFSLNVMEVPRLQKITINMGLG